MNQADALLAHTFADFLRVMRGLGLSRYSLLVEKRIVITRNTASFSLVFAAMRRGHDLSFTLGSQVLRFPEEQGLIFNNFQSGKTLRGSNDAVLVEPDVACPEVCAVHTCCDGIHPRCIRAWLGPFGGSLVSGRADCRGPGGRCLSPPFK